MSTVPIKMFCIMQVRLICDAFLNSGVQEKAPVRDVCLIGSNLSSMIQDAFTVSASRVQVRLETIRRNGVPGSSHRELPDQVVSISISREDGSSILHIKSSNS